jgi:hypothetical protein
MPRSGTTIGPNVLSDIIHEYLSRLAVCNFTMQFDRLLVVGTFPHASSVWTVLLDEICTLLLRIWVEVMEADKKSLHSGLV